MTDARTRQQRPGDMYLRCGEKSAGARTVYSGPQSKPRSAAIFGQFPFARVACGAISLSKQKGTRGAWGWFSGGRVDHRVAAWTAKK